MFFCAAVACVCCIDGKHVAALLLQGQAKHLHVLLLLLALHMHTTAIMLQCCSYRCMPRMNACVVAAGTAHAALHCSTAVQHAQRWLGKAAARPVNHCTRNSQQPALQQQAAAALGQLANDSKNTTLNGCRVQVCSFPAGAFTSQQL